MSQQPHCTKRFYWSESSHAHRQHILNTLSPDDTDRLIVALKAHGWSFQPYTRTRNTRRFLGWWVHSDQLPYTRGDAREYNHDAKTVFLLYADLDLDEVLSNDEVTQ